MSEHFLFGMKTYANKRASQWLLLQILPWKSSLSKQNIYKDASFGNKLHVVRQTQNNWFNKKCPKMVTWTCMPGLPRIHGQILKLTHWISESGEPLASKTNLNLNTNVFKSTWSASSLRFYSLSQFLFWKESPLLQNLEAFLFWLLDYFGLHT